MFMRSEAPIICGSTSGAARLCAWRMENLQRMRPAVLQAGARSFCPASIRSMAKPYMNTAAKPVKLSTLQVNADKPFVSTGTTFRGSNRCAVVLECAAAEGSAEFGIEYRKAGQEQTERVSFSANFDSVKSRQLCLSFKADAGADYSFRTFIVSEDDTTYGAWNDCPGSYGGSHFDGCAAERRRRCVCLGIHGPVRRRLHPDGSGSRNGRAIRYDRRIAQSRKRGHDAPARLLSGSRRNRPVLRSG